MSSEDVLEQAQKLRESGLTIREVAVKLDVTWDQVRSWQRSGWRLKQGPRGAAARRRYPPELLAEAAAVSFSIAQVVRYVGAPSGGGSHSYISRLLKEYEVECDHFTGQGHMRGKVARGRVPAKDLLIERTKGDRTEGGRLRRALIEVGVPYRCACGVSEWQGQPIVLHVDHIDGNWLDNRLQNLRLLCPNCHSQTENYAGRGRGKKAQNEDREAKGWTSLPGLGDPVQPGS